MDLRCGSEDMSSRAAEPYLLFQIDARRYGLPVASVSEVLPALAVDPLPGGGEALAGAITLRGRMIPVLASRSYLGHEAREVLAQDHFLIADVGGRALAVPCDRALGLALLSLEHESAGELVHDCDHIEGVARDEDGLILVPRLHACLPQRAAA